MTVGRYAGGFAALAIVCACLAVGAVVLRRRLLPGWSGAVARLAECVLGLALLVAILEILGALGLFRLVPIVAACAAAAAGLWAWETRLMRPGSSAPHPKPPGSSAPAHPKPPGSSAPPDPKPPGSSAPEAAPRPEPRTGLPQAAKWPVAVALIAAAVVVAEWAVPTLISYDIGIRSFDSLWYHLPWAASFAQTGRVTSLRFTDVEYLTAFYPATAELLHGLGIVLLARDTLSPAINMAWLLLCLLAGWCIGRPRGLGPATMTGAALALATPMVRISQGGTAANDVAGVALLLAAVAVAVRAIGELGRSAALGSSVQGSGRGADSAAELPRGFEGSGGPGDSGAGLPGTWRAGLVIAAIAAGLAVGVKLSLVAPVLALSVGTIVLAGRGRRGRAAAAWIPAFVLAGGYWYVRNLLAVGNPLPWVGLGILSTPAAPLQQHTGYSIAHYATDTGIWTRFFAPGLASGLGRWWFVIVAIAVLGPVLCVLGRPSRRTAPRLPPPGRRSLQQPMARMLGLVALASLAAYLITPESAAGPSGDPSGFAFNLRYAAPGLTLALAVTPLAAWLDGARARVVTLTVLAVTLGVTIAEGRLWHPGYVAGAVLVGVVALAALGAGRLIARRRPTTAVLVGGALALFAAVGVAGYGGQRHYLRGRYSFQPGVSSLSTLWAWARGIHNARIGLVGTFGGFQSYPLLGLDDSNRVQYIADQGSHGSFTTIRTCRAWRSAVNAGHYRYVVTTPARNPWTPRTLEFSPEGEWTSSDPAARLVFHHSAYRQSISVFELSGPLNPACD